MELFPNGGAVSMLICLINIAVKYVGILGQLPGRGAALPETLEARAVGQANGFGGTRAD